MTHDEFEDTLYRARVATWFGLSITMDVMLMAGSTAGVIAAKAIALPWAGAMFVPAAIAAYLTMSTGKTLMEAEAQFGDEDPRCAKIGRRNEALGNLAAVLFSAGLLATYLGW